MPFTPSGERGREGGGALPEPPGGPSTFRWPASANDVMRTLQAAGGTPLRFTRISQEVRHRAGRGDDPESERYGDVRAYRGLVDLRSNGIAKKVEVGWLLSPRA